MKSFDEKWQAAAARARQARRPDEAAPLGFATRVAARALRSESGSSEILWLRLALRSLAGVLTVLAIYALLELPHVRERHPLAPGVENTVAELVWAL